MREFGPYRIESLIGSGGMGEVHLAYDTRRDREVALKLLPSALSDDAEYLKRFKRESNTVARLREPHVIPIHDYGEIDNRLFIDMRLVDGQSLAAMLAKGGPISPDRAVHLIEQVAQALDAAHADGLVHRDIKPSNILVTASSFVYVVDFGIAHAIGHTRSRLTMTGATLGTLDYMAPERFDNRPVGPRTDVYSLACVLFECLTAVKPFPGEDLPSLLYAHLYMKPPMVSEANAGVPAELDAVIARGMAKDAGDRFASAGELAAAARAALNAAVAKAASETPPVKAAAPPGSRNGGSPGRKPSGDSTVGIPMVQSPPAQPPATGSPPPPGSPPPAPAGSQAGRPEGRRRTLALLLVVAVVVAAISVVATLLATRTMPGAGTAATTDPAGPPAAAPVPVEPGAVRAIGNSVDTPTVGATVPVGPTPGYVEVAPNGEYAYIANRAAGVVTVFDTVRRAVTTTIPVPEGGPQFIAFSPDGTRAYVSIYNTDRTVNVVGVLDTATSTFVATVPVGVRPFAPDVTPDGTRVYVPNHDSGSISVIDTATNTVSQTIDVAPNPHWVDLSADGTRVYAANHESNVISIIDTATNGVLTTVPVGKSPHSILSHPTKPLVFNVNYDSNSMSVTDTTTGAVTATVPTGNHPQDISLAADGKHGYLATVDDNAIQVFDTTTLEITATVPTGRSPTSIGVAPDGRQAYVTNLADGTITVLNIAGTA